MRGIVRTMVAVATGLGLALPAWTQSGIHPGFTFTSLRPTGFNPGVSGLDTLPNGDLVVVTWDGFGKDKGSVYIVSNVRTGTSANITYKKFAGSLNEPLGVKVLNGEIHVITRDQILVLPDANKDGTAETPRKLADNWGTLANDPKILEFAFGLPYKAGKFYMGLATAWPLTNSQARERGCILEVDATSGAHTPFACGFRTPNGMALGPDDELFVTENQGNWVPSSKFTRVSKGKFYGVKKDLPSGFSSNTETPPSIWMPHSNTLSVSPTQPVWMKAGIFKGQFIAGDNNLGTLQRFFLEKVNGEYQGALFRFTAGLEAGANRIIANGDGSFYVGGIGTNLWAGWDWNDRWSGLQRLTPNGQTAFEMLAIRSKGSNSFEVEFTEPAAAGAGTAANWQVQQWAYVPAADYGVGKQTTENLTVQSAQLSTDGLKATLTIPGLKARDVVYFRLNNVASKAGKNIWSNEAWYTLNAFGPGTDVEVTPPVALGRDGEKYREAGAGRLVSAAWGTAGTLAGTPGALRFRVLASGPFRADIRDARGALVETRSGIGPLEVTSTAVPGRGAYAVTVTAAGGRETAWIRAGR